MSGAEKLRVLVVDDSLVYRTIIRKVLAKMPNVEVVGIAAAHQPIGPGHPKLWLQTLSSIKVGKPNMSFV